MSSELAGKVAVVTGAAAGIGLASAKAMLAAGARVVLVERDEAALSRVCERHGDAAIPLKMDLLDAAACAELTPRVLGKTGQNGCRRRTIKPSVSSVTAKSPRDLFFCNA